MTKVDWDDIQRIIAARRFAVACHEAIGQKYAGKPYSYHLDSVAWWGRKFGYVDYVSQASFFLHDTVEDTSTTIIEIDEHFGMQVMARVWAVTGRGPNRKTRNADIYRKLMEFPPAQIQKLCDRLANHEASLHDPMNVGYSDTRMVGMYFREQEEFTAAMTFPPSIMLQTLAGQYDEMARILDRKDS